ncbi:MAG: helix-hairpin-helix domain-containing protein [Syntrophomonadaceae bacterium]
MMNIDKRCIAVAIILLLITFGVGVKYGSWHQQQAEPDEIILDEASQIAEDLSEKENEEIQVYVTGLVERPGVYRLTAESRINEAVSMAGPLPEADLTYVDMARKVQDEETILVPAKGAEIPVTGSSVNPVSASAVNSHGKLNINKATAKELDEQLTGIGPALAQRIVDYRTENGPFKQIEDIKSVSGIGDKRFADIEADITVR